MQDEYLLYQDVSQAKKGNESISGRDKSASESHTHMKLSTGDVVKCYSSMRPLADKEVCIPNITYVDQTHWSKWGNWASGHNLSENKEG